MSSTLMRAVPAVAAQLKKNIGLVDLIAIGVGSSIGVSIFGVLAPASRLAGPGLLLALACAAVPMTLFALIYAFLSSAAPTSGASFVWPHRFINPTTGFMVAWLRILGSTGAIIQHGAILLLYLNEGLHISPPKKTTLLALFLVFYLLNVRGAAVAAGAQIVMTAALVLILIAYACLGAPHLEAEHFVPLLPDGLPGVLAAIPVLAGLFIGVEFSAEVGEEVRDGRRLIARGIGLSVATVVTIYAAVSTVTVGILGAPALSASKAPLLEAGSHFLGHYGYLAITCAALLAIATSLNGVILIFSRFLFAMGRAGALPAVLGRAHPKWGTPHVAMTLVLVLSTVGLLLPDELLFLFLAVNLPSLFKYMANCVAAMFLVRNHPELYEAAPFRPRRTLIIPIAVTGITCAALMVLAGMSSDWRPYAILAGWAAVGATYWRLRRRNRVMAAFPDNSTAAP